MAGLIMMPKLEPAIDFPHLTMASAARRSFDSIEPKPTCRLVQIDNSTLLIPLGKLQGDNALLDAERFEIAALKFTVARALCIKKRARAS
jgi:hypothetical protein